MIRWLRRLRGVFTLVISELEDYSSNIFFVILSASVGFAVSIIFGFSFSSSFDLISLVSSMKFIAMSIR